MAIIKLGIDALDVWEYTPNELKMIAESRGFKARLELKDNIVLAYYIESLARHKKLPKLNKLLKEVDKPSLSRGDMVLKMMQNNSIV